MPSGEKSTYTHTTPHTNTTHTHTHTHTHTYTHTHTHHTHRATDRTEEPWVIDFATNLGGKLINC